MRPGKQVDIVRIYKLMKHVIKGSHSTNFEYADKVILAEYQELAHIYILVKLYMDRQ